MPEDLLAFREMGFCNISADAKKTLTLHAIHYLFASALGIVIIPQTIYEIRKW